MMPKIDAGFFEGDRNSETHSFERYELLESPAILPERIWLDIKDLHPRKSFLRSAEWFIENRANGLEILKETVEINSMIRGGVPVLKGTRFTVSQLLAEMSETRGPDEIAENFDLNADQIRDLLRGLAMVMNKSATK